MQHFAQIFEFPDIGLVLVKHDRQEDGDGPEVRFYAKPARLGVCSVAMCWADSETSWRESELFMQTLERDQVGDIVRKALFSGPLAKLAVNDDEDDHAQD